MAAPLPLLEPGRYPSLNGDASDEFIVGPKLIVVRGGTKQHAVWTKNAEATHVALAEYGIDRFAVSALVGYDPLALAKAARIENRQICCSSVDRLRDAGFSSQLTRGGNHISVWLPDAEPETIQKLMDAYDDPIPNPWQA